jgi:hypothetical protein
MKAFPTHKEEGMELRDYFAAQAMQGILSKYGMAAPDLDRGFIGCDAEIAIWSYEIADAMMKARDQHGE